MWYDADIDRLMARTANRPIPAGRMARGEALAFGLVLSAFAVFTLGLVANWLAGGLLAFTIFYYVVVYTMWLKRSTPQNIVIGGAAGALPPMVGYAAAAGSLDLSSLLLFAHDLRLDAAAFLVAGAGQGRGLRPRRRADGARMSGARTRTRLQILLYSLLLAPIGAAALVLGFAGPVYGAVACLGGIGMILWRLGGVLAPRGRSGAENRDAQFRLLDPLSLHAFRRSGGRAPDDDLAGSLSHADANPPTSR